MTLSAYTTADIESLRKTGVYKIWHTEYPENLYIGSAASIDFRNDNKGFCGRWKTHLSHLRLNKHHSKYLQRVVNKYGIDKLRFEILEICKSEECTVREQYYLDKYSPVYNGCKIAGSPLGTKHPEIWKIVHQYDPFGNYIKSFDSIRDAEKETNVDRASISKAAKGSRPAAGKYMWSFDINKPPIPLRVIEQYTLDDKLINKFTSLTEVQNALNINSNTAIRNCFIGKQKQAYGYKWIDVINNWKKE
jgi:hypothetical protein